LILGMKIPKSRKAKKNSGRLKSSLCKRQMSGSGKFSRNLKLLISIR